LQHPTQQLPGTEEMLLPNEFIDRSRPHPGRQRHLPAPICIHTRLKEVDNGVSGGDSKSLYSIPKLLFGKCTENGKWELKVEKMSKGHPHFPFSIFHFPFWVSPRSFENEH
jgi:hypothetical protein